MGYDYWMVELLNKWKKTSTSKKSYVFPEYLWMYNRIY